MEERKRRRFDLPNLAASVTPQVLLTMLRAMEWSAKLRPSLRDELRAETADGARTDLAFSISLSTRDDRIRAWVRVEGGKLRTGAGALAPVDAAIVFRDASSMQAFLLQSGHRDLHVWLLDGRMTVEGNLACVGKLAQLASANRMRGSAIPHGYSASAHDTDPERDLGALFRRTTTTPRPFGAATGACLLPDPALADMTLDELPGLRRRLEDHLSHEPRLCTERARLYTEAAMRLEHDGPPTHPVLLQARLLAYVMRNKRAIVHDDDLVLGTTTSQPIGAPVYPEHGGTLLWSELMHLPARSIAPLGLDRDDLNLLNRRILPYWMRRSTIELARQLAPDTAPLRWERSGHLFALNKQHGYTRAIPDLQTVLRHGLRAMIDETLQVQTTAQTPEQKAYHQAVIEVLASVMGYAERLADEAERLAGATSSEERRKELLEAALSCRRCPAEPARTLRDALNAIRICLVALAQEGPADGLSLGRLDLLLQPFLERELQKSETAGERRASLRRVIELVGTFLLRVSDHVPALPTLAASMRAGAGACQAVTVGGITADGSSAVCDMTYVLLRTFELLRVAEPVLHARFHPGANPDYYLHRLCEASLLTGGAPIIHHDAPLISALMRQGFPLVRARDWAATGWGVPSIGGEQWAHPGAVVLNLVAPLEMALNDGVHPRATETKGPNTGAPRAFRSFDELLLAFRAQLQHVVLQAVRGDTALAQTWQRACPRPLLSALMLGTQDAGHDVTDGGARYQATGFDVVGFADVVDSLAAIERVVFDSRTASLDELMRAMAANFEGYSSLHDQLLRTVPKYGDGSPEALTLARKLSSMVREALRAHDTPLGGPHVPGYCGMTAHVVWGRVTGALPSGRPRREPFAAGAAPSHRSVGTLADRLRHAAAIHADDAPQGFMLVVRCGDDGADQPGMVEQLVQTLCAFFSKGGLVAQLDTLHPQLLRRAAERPAAFSDLLVPVCGYDAYLGTLPRVARDDLFQRAGIEQAHGEAETDEPYDESDDDDVLQTEDEAEEESIAADAR